MIVENEKSLRLVLVEYWNKVLDFSKANTWEDKKIKTSYVVGWVLEENDFGISIITHLHKGEDISKKDWETYISFNGRKFHIQREGITKIIELL